MLISLMYQVFRIFWLSNLVL